jgi:large subunit ribosomal protein L10
MPKTKAQKQIILDALNKKVKDAKTIIFATYSKIGVKQSEDLRKSLKKEGSEYLVAKKTLLERALNKIQISAPLIKDCKQNLSVIFGYEDEVSPAKILEKFKKENPDIIDFYGGVMDKVFINREQAINLAKIPSKIELYAKLVGTINAPVSGFVNVLAGNFRNLLGVLQSIGEKKPN